MLIKLLRRINTLLSTERVFVCVIIFIILFVSLFYLLYFTSIAPQNTFFPLIHNYNSDYNLYLQFIRQSMEGRWTMITRYTPENFPPRFAYFTFILLGKIAAITKIDPPYTYTLSRIVFGISFLILIYKLIKITFPDNKNRRKLAFFLTVFGSGFWAVNQTVSGITVSRFLNFWTENDVIERFFYLPHHLSAKALMVLSLILLYKCLQKKSYLLLLLSIAAGFLCGLSSPFVLATFEITLGTSLVLIMLLHWKNIRCVLNILLPLSLFILTTSVSLLYLFWVEHASFPWNNYIGWEKILFPITYRDLLYSMGPAFILSLIVLPEIIKTKRLLYIILISWLAQPWLGVFILSRFSILTNIRFLSSSYFIPGGILAALGLNILADWTAKLFKIKKAVLSTTFILILSFIFSIDILTNFKSHLQYYSGKYYNFYLPNSLLSAFDFLDSETAKDSVVLAHGIMGNLIPAYSHNKVVLGHQINTYDFDIKGTELVKFFAQEDLDFSKKLLDKYGVSYVFFSLDTPPPQSKFISDLRLKNIFENDSARIYKVTR